MFQKTHNFKINIGCIPKNKQQNKKNIINKKSPEAYFNFFEKIKKRLTSPT